MVFGMCSGSVGIHETPVERSFEPSCVLKHFSPERVLVLHECSDIVQQAQVGVAETSSGPVEDEQHARECPQSVCAITEHSDACVTEVTACKKGWTEKKSMQKASTTLNNVAAEILHAEARNELKDSVDVKAAVSSCCGGDAEREIWRRVSHAAPSSDAQAAESSRWHLPKDETRGLSCASVRGRRGRGARARGRVRLRERRKLTFCDSATGTCADACRSKVEVINSLSSYSSSLDHHLQAHNCGSVNGDLGMMIEKDSGENFPEMKVQSCCSPHEEEFPRQDSEFFRRACARDKKLDRYHTGLSNDVGKSFNPAGSREASEILQKRCEPVPHCHYGDEGQFLSRLLARVWRAKGSHARGGPAVVVRGAEGANVAPANGIVKRWFGSHQKKHGNIASHVKYLQWVFRSARLISPTGWTKGLPGWVWSVLQICRRKRLTKCSLGANLAGDEEFKSQERLANSMLDWYGQYVAILRGRMSGDAPRFCDLCCGGGLVAEGVRRAGGVPYGLDLEDQPSFKCRFGSDCFLKGDGTDWSLVRGWQKRHRLEFAGASPPCKFYSTARQKGEAKQPPLIERMRDMLQTFFTWWWIENVMGAKPALHKNAVEVDGPFFGLQVFRSRLFETSFPLHVDDSVRAAANILRSRCCLGYRNRWRSFDEFGRPYHKPCCGGNVFVPIGETPWRCTLEECAVAMGVDPGHTSYDRLAQGVPPQYSQWVFSQMCMRMVQREFGCPAITFDEMRANPSKAKRVLAQWLLGAGADRPSAGMSWVRRRAQEVEVDLEGGGRANVERVAGALHACRVKEDKPWRAPPEVPVRSKKVESPTCPSVALPGVTYPEHKVMRCFAAAKGDGVGECIHQPVLQAVIDESSFRELFYAHFGDYDCQWSELGSLPWLGVLRQCELLESSEIPVATNLVGKNTYLEVASESLQKVFAVCEEAILLGGRGTRMTVVTPQGGVAFPTSWDGVDCEVTYGGADALAPQGLRAAWCGRRHGPRFSSPLVHADVRGDMDVRDQDDYKEDKEAKNELSWTPISHNPNVWRGKGLPADVEEIMTGGVKIDMDLDASCFQVPQYPFPDDQAMLEGIMEADRALSVGHMEYVPDEHVERVLKENVVHPWLIVWQGKWRLCQDYSSGTNMAAKSGPFGLPSPWDARPILKPGSYMAKYDLRDFFWSIPVNKESRCRLVMRHPGTGRLMWCRSLPFGYLDSPRQACRVSEALAGEMRRRAAGKGIHFLCYVDDYLVVGDNYELTLEGNRIFEEVMSEFCMQWSPAKQRGPVQCIEFLGLLICNVKGHRCIALSEKRQGKLKSMIGDWLEQRPGDGSVLKVEPKLLAKLLGHLVFASQVVPGGRTYMQSMLSSFSGLEVDWKHGLVRASKGHWDRVSLSREFWLDLEWWRDHLELRNCVPLDEPQMCEAMVAGTDASDWGVGTIIWVDGHKEECNMEFTRAERRRPINFRELLGIVRIVELHGERLRGVKVMIETDNMAAKGAAEKLASTAASMQELLRRLYSCAERYGIMLKVIHTPGAKLFRPDQTSRGDPIEEPRLRFNADEFRLLDLRFGPFTEFVGAERRHARSATAVDRAEPRLWLHPAHNTVGTALRLLGERMAGYDGDDSSHRGPPPSGIIVVPFAPDANWWSMTRHFACVGRWELGSRHLEMNQLGTWKSVASKRASIALAFPRSTGSFIAPVELPVGMTSYRCDDKEMGYVHALDDSEYLRGMMMPLLPGSFVYSPNLSGGRGELLMVWHAFHPEIAGREIDELGEWRVSCVELLLKEKKGQRSYEYVFDKRDSFARGGRQLAWELSVGLLWMVDHLVKVDAEMEPTATAGGVASPKLAVVELERRTFTFDYAKAESEIQHAKDMHMGLGDPLSRPLSTPMRGESLEHRLAAIELSGAEGADVAAADELQLARQSADEAAGLRQRPQYAPKAKSVRKAPIVNNRRAVICRYSSQFCEGCNEEFKFGEKIVTGFRAMVHPISSGHPDCLELALGKQTAREEHLKNKSKNALAQGKDSEFAQEATVVDTVKATQFISLKDGDRLDMVRNCLNGNCTEKNEVRLMCIRGCGRGVHLVACCRTSSNYAAAGRLVCVECRLKEIVEGGATNTAPASLVQQVTLAVLAEITTGAVSTAAGRNQFVSLERKWAMESFAKGDGTPAMVKLPRHNIEAFIAWMWWLVTDADRSRSFGTIMRTAGAVMTMLELDDWTKTKRVKAQIKEIESKCDVEHDPCTQTTSRLIDLMVNNTIEAVCGKGKSSVFNSLLATRTKGLLTLELLAGLRVGEATSSGDLHGLAANDLAFLKPANASAEDGLGETVEVVVRDSKTGLGRHAAFVATTKGPVALEGAKHMRRLVRASGMKMAKKVEGGFHVESPNYWVARLDLGAMSDKKIASFLKAVADTRCEMIIEQAAAIKKYVKERTTSKSLPLEARYVNVAGGAKLGKDKFDEQLTVVRDFLEKTGVGAHTTFVPGPLVRATLGYKLTHMPLVSASTYTHLIGAIWKAYEISKEMNEPDTELDLQGLEEPKFGNHSLRRHADKKARESLPMQINIKEGWNDITKEVINYFFGWCLKEMSKEMQLHYAGMDRMARRRLARVTMFF